MRYLLSLIAIIAFQLLALDSFAQITGVSSPAVGSQQTYSYNSPTTIFTPQWRMDIPRGTINNTSQSGNTYYVTITWNTTGTETLALLDGMIPKAQLAINVVVPPPPVPVANAASSISSSSFNANWSASSGASSYRVDVSTVSNFASFVSGFNNASTSSLALSVTGLTANTTYYYRVRAANAAGSASGNSNVITVTTGPATPVATAATNVTASSFTANWNVAAGATSYTAEVSTDLSFASVIGWTSGTNSVSTTGLNGNTTYYYRVKSSNAIGSSGYSNVVTVVTPPTPPTVSAATSVNSGSFVANWGSVAGATAYLLEVSSTSDFSTLQVGYNPLSTAALSASVTGLGAGETYYYRVRAQNSGWTTGYSNVIQVLLIPNAPPVNPASTITVNSFVANWSTAMGATSYRLDVSDVSNFATLLPGYNNLSVAGLSQSITGLSPGTTYYYRVRGENAAGTSGNSSSTSALTLPNPPTALAATLITESGFTANWTSVPTATGYRVDVSTSNTFSSFVAGYNDFFSSSTSAIITGLSSGTTYYYRVRTINPSGASSNSSVINVLTISAPPVLNNATSVTTTSFVQAWPAVTGAASYRLDVATDDQFLNFVSGYNNLTVTGVTRTISGLTAGSTYYVRARSVNASGTSTNSAVATRLTLPVAPVANPGSNIKSFEFAASWSAVPSATSYRLDVSLSSTFATFLSGYNNRTVNGNTEYATGLITGTLYYYRVRAVNAAAHRQTRRPSR